MKKIGLVDFYIDEWHSNTYLGLFSRAVEELRLDYSVAYAWAELDRFENRRSTDEWCAEKNITRVNTLEELCELSDNILILAPADPQKHLEYAKTVLRYGKATYIDKTFAQSCTEAKEIYALAEKYGTPIFSTSALRYASELDALVGAQSFVSQGGGRSLEEYIVHQIEMAVKVMGTDATEVHLFDRDAHATVIVNFNGRTATLNFSKSAPFVVDGILEDSKACYLPVSDGDYFYRLIKDILTFFENSTPPFSKEETIAVIAIRDAIINARAKSTITEKIEK
jgi:hypothetical protein